MRILVAAGASGGHILPALSFINALKNKRQGVDVLLVVPKRSLKYNLALGDIKVKYVSFLPVGLSLELKNLVAVIKLFQGTLESLILVCAFKPDIVVGFGTLDTAALVIFAWMARIKTLIHEQNVTPGRANRLLAKFCDRIAVSFEETKVYLKGFENKIVLTGNPLPSGLLAVDREEALRYFGFSQDKFTVLVMGGSLGSHRINLAFLECVSSFKDRSKLRVIHITGASDQEFINNSYKSLNLSAKALGFLSEMQLAYSACDLVVSRAGANTINEIIFFKLPAVLIPYPGAYAHQLNNAVILEKKGCAVVVRDEDLDAKALQAAMEEFLSNPAKLKEMRYGYNSFKLYNASALLADEVISLNYN